MTETLDPSQDPQGGHAVEDGARCGRPYDHNGNRTLEYTLTRILAKCRNSSKTIWSAFVLAM